MKKKAVIILALSLLCGFSAAVHGIGEKTISLGGAAAWNMAEVRAGITQVARVRSNPVLMLSSAATGNTTGTVAPTSAAAASAASLDLSISFDESNPALFRDRTGHYRLGVSPALQTVERRFARIGTGAALFSASSRNDTVPAVKIASDGAGQSNAGGLNGPLVIEVSSRNALFAPDSHIRDFSIEFWLYPLNMENGEQVLTWISSRPLPARQTAAAGGGQTRYAFQRIQCVAVKNRLQWTFADFFTSPDNADHIDLSIAGNSPVVPKNWSHHLIRFDAGTGMLEYLVNGKSEAIEYASSTGHEGGEVYTPIAGEGGSFVVGSHFMGIMDEFKIHSAWLESPVVHKYPARGGRMETGAIDLGEGSSGVQRVDATGGRTAIKGTQVSSEFQENGRFRFADDSEMQFFIRAAENPYLWDETDWRSFTPGNSLAGTIRGRYVQVAVDFYPSADGETSPYLEALQIHYLPNEPPLPPASVIAVAEDGGVRLRWKNSPDTDTAGYLVYYGVTRDEYFSEDAAQGASPLDAGKRNTIVIDGLKNGTLYYFRIAAYDRRDSNGAFHAGEFSREVSARPLRGLAALSPGQR